LETKKENKKCGDWGVTHISRPLATPCFEWLKQSHHEIKERDDEKKIYIKNKKNRGSNQLACEMQLFRSDRVQRDEEKTQRKMPFYSRQQLERVKGQD